MMSFFGNEIFALAVFVDFTADSNIDSNDFFSSSKGRVLTKSKTSFICLDIFSTAFFIISSRFLILASSFDVISINSTAFLITPRGFLRSCATLADSWPMELNLSAPKIACDLTCSASKIKSHFKFTSAWCFSIASFEGPSKMQNNLSSFSLKSNSTCLTPCSSMGLLASF